MISAGEIHSRLSASWPQILVQLGIPEAVLRNKHGPCPACGGSDRFRFDNKRSQGNYICGQCGAGDGFTLLERVHGWTFAETRKRVIEAAGLTSADSASAQVRTSLPALIPRKAAAAPPARVRRLRRDCCAIDSCSDAVEYLGSRGLWPLPPACPLKACTTVEYWQEGERLGRFPALVADVVDLAGKLVTCHVTYLQDGRKLTGHEPRKILSSLTDRIGCAVRLMPATDVLGIAEGIETALSAAALDDVPVWAALSAALLSRFEPPPGVTTLRVYADRDEAGFSAAHRLKERLQGRLRIEIRIPSAPAKDWSDVLIAHAPQRPLRAAKDLPMSNVIALRSPLPDTSDVPPLPARYEAARAALAECERIDECQAWADQAIAIASYARQAKDGSLLAMARRIQARAVRRCGELLQQIPRTDEATRYGEAACGPPGDSTSYENTAGREKAADEAGLSERQRKTALRVAAVPAAAFDAQVEGPRPPSITQLASQGTAPRADRVAAVPPLQHRVEYDLSPACEPIAEFVRFCGQNEPSTLARACSARDAATLKHGISKLDRWLDRFLTNLPE